MYSWSVDSGFKVHSQTCLVINSWIEIKKECLCTEISKQRVICSNYQTSKHFRLRVEQKFLSTSDVWDLIIHIEHLPEHTTLYVPLEQRACLKWWSSPHVLSSNAATSNDVRLCASNYNHWENKCFTMISLYLNRDLIQTQCGCITTSRCWPQCVTFLWFYFGFSNMASNLTNWAQG